MWQAEDTNLDRHVALKRLKPWPAAPPTPPCVDAPPDYCAAVTGAERVPFDVRFDTGTDRLDNRATRNLDLLAASTPPGAG